MNQAVVGHNGRFLKEGGGARKLLAKEKKRLFQARSSLGMGVG